MAEFLTTKSVASHLEEIIKKSRKKLFIITPYLKLSALLYERIKEAAGRNVHCVFVYGRTGISKTERELLESLKCSHYYKEELHGRCYANEEAALITSMNLHSFSEANNREFGVLLTKQNDRKEFEACIEEIKSIISNSDTRREQRKANDIIYSPPGDFDWDKFRTFYAEELEKVFNKNFTVQQEIIISTNFPATQCEFSTSNGFATFDFVLDKSVSDNLRDQYLDKLRLVMSPTRVFWNSSGISLYAPEDIFETKMSEKDYAEFCVSRVQKFIPEFRTVLEEILLRRPNNL